MMKLSALTSRRNLALAGAACLLLVWWVMGSKPAPIIYNTPPIQHENGTVEYHLIDDGKDRERGTKDDVDWVLLFPEDVLVRRAGDILTIDQARRFQDSPFNRDLSFTLDLPDLDYSNYAYNDHPNGYDEHQKTLLNIFISADPVEYGTGKLEKATSPFSAMVDMEANYKCRRAKEVGPGVFQLRPVNKDELAQMTVMYGAESQWWWPTQYFMPPVCVKPRPDKSVPVRFAIYDVQDKPIGIGDCREPKEVGGSIFEACRFEFWLPQHREAVFSLERRYIPELREIYKSVVKLLSAATDVEKSRNMEEWSN